MYACQNIPLFLAPYAIAQGEVSINFISVGSMKRSPKERNTNKT